MSIPIDKSFNFTVTLTLEFDQVSENFNLAYK